MSIESMSRVLHHSTLTGTNKLILLGIANHDGDGGAWPSIETLMAYGNCSESSVHRAIRAAVAAGELVVVHQGGGHADMRADRRPNLYRITVGVQSDGVPSATLRADGVPSVTRRGAAGDTDGVPPEAPELSSNHHSTVIAPDGDAQQEALLPEPQRGAKRRKPEVPLPDTWKPDEAWTEENLPGLSGEEYRRVMGAFRAHAQAHDRRCRDWDAAWRQWVHKEAAMRAARARR
jgi:hypothetical protein